MEGMEGMEEALVYWLSGFHTFAKVWNRSGLAALAPHTAQLPRTPHSATNTKRGNKYELRVESRYQRFEPSAAGFSQD